MTYYKKSETVQALQMTEHYAEYQDDEPAWLRAAWHKPPGSPGSVHLNGYCLFAATLRGLILVNVGDWLVFTGTNIAVVGDEEFKKTYEPMENADAEEKPIANARCLLCGDQMFGDNVQLVHKVCPPKEAEEK